MRARPQPVLFSLAILVLLLPIPCGVNDAEGGRRPGRGAPGAAADAPTGIAGLILEVREGRLLVASVEPGSAAASAGILSGDRILILNDLNLIDLDPLTPGAALDRIAASPSPEIRLLLGRGAGTLGVILPRDQPPAGRTIGAPPEIGSMAPDFTAIDLNEEEIRLAALRGRPVLVDFWASWCPPCRGASLTLRRISGVYEERLAIVGVSLDDDRRAFEAFIYNQHLPGRQIFDGGWNGPIASLYGVAAVGIPYAVLIDGDGRVAARAPALTDLEDEISRRVAEPDSERREGR